MASSQMKKLDDLFNQEACLLYGVHRDIAWLDIELKNVRVFLDGAERSGDELIQEWMNQVRELAYDVEDLIDQFTIQMKSQRPCFSKKLIACYRFRSEIKGVKALTRSIMKRRSVFQIQIKAEERAISNSYSGDLLPFDLIKEADGLRKDEDAAKLVELLVTESSKLEVMSVVGMGGIGKTTLVKKVYDQEKIKKHFDSRSWVTVSRSATILGLLKTMLKGFYKDSSEDTETIDSMDSEKELYLCLTSYLLYKRFLLVLDDVWSEDVWKRMIISLPDRENGSRIILTTRLSSFVFQLGVVNHIHELRVLPEDEAWSLFCDKAFRKNGLEKVPEELERVAQLIVDDCEGLPLSISAIGGILYKRKLELAEWTKALRSLNSELANNPSTERVWGILSLCINDLHHLLKNCFLYLCLFPKDCEMSIKMLIRLWIGEGFVVASEEMTMEQVAMVYIKELIDRNLIQVSRVNASGLIRACRVHDIMRSLALSMSVSEKFGEISTSITTTTIYSKTRRLSIQEPPKCIEVCTDKPHLRSLLTFKVGHLPDTLSSILPKLRLLRVLDLGGVLLQNLPNEVGNLIHLRYLGLMNTGIQELPMSLLKLQRLETLDCRGTNLDHVPSEISSLHNLTHLLIYKRKASHTEFWIQVLSTGKFSVHEEYVPFNVSVGRLTSLRTLKHVRVDLTVFKELGELNQLEKLKIQLVNVEDGHELWGSLQRMRNLRSLYLSSMDVQNPVSLESMPSPLSLPPLNQLCLNAILVKLPMSLCSLRSLRMLALVSCALIEDPLVALQSLPNLMFLMLFKAYKGNIMGRDGVREFPNLKTLSLIHLEELEGLEGMQEGCMPLLQVITIVGCKKLKMLDHSFRYLTSLQNLDFGDMPIDFLRRLHPVSGEDYHKVHHVPSIKLYYLDNEKYVYMNLK
ncbi:hypothetical protein AMTR_s00190p00027950 [Amborella trichopoda]|uniref:NB-ARC domain-containing protein n=2 Tax=Amborella trichopoda TaxID=13333 RepID=U5CYM5_AMBTC|nr:hypothetical protein AMTR_s00190p00027950 [Amborella trichopoda]